LWKSDGTTVGTVLVKDIEPGFGSSSPKGLSSVRGSLLFSAQTSAHGREPWWSTGTEAGTSLIQDIVPGPDSSDPLGFVASGELAYFAASQLSIGTELWAVPLSEVTISSLSVDDVAIAEGNAGSTIVEFTVRLSAPSTQVVTVSYATEDRTATAGIDYVAATGTLTFPPGTTVLEVPVTILGDTIGEGNETFVLALSAPANATITDAQATASILDDEASGFYTQAPCRVADTRLPVDGPALAANAARTFVVAGRCGVPATAKAVALNVTVVNPSDFGDLRLYPAGLPPPGASSLNFRAGGPRANNAVVPLGVDGRIGIQCDMPVGSTGTTHLVVDVNGYFQ
jgi:ELWxxDGT repeat protein